MSVLASRAYCWTIERRDGAGFAVTSHDRDLVVGGVRYEAAPGTLPAAITKQLGLKEADAEVAGSLSSGALDEADLEMGRWDGARVRLVVADWEDPDAPLIPLLAGELGEVETGGDGFTAALRGAAAKLARAACPETSPECRAELGDKACSVDMAARRAMRTVVGVEANDLTLDEAVGDEFLWGRVRFLDGANCGLSTSMVAVEGPTVTLRDVMRGAVLAGERVLLAEGCDKRFATCCARFGNAANFRGEPHLPGNDLLTRYPGN
jgi:uncharacterized phage protein (TIGR02218 family)